MTNTYLRDGNYVAYAPSSPVAAGAVVVQGDLVGVAITPIAAGWIGSLAVAGVFVLPKATGTGTGLSVGTKVYWDATAGVVTASDGSGTNKYVGKVVAAATTGDATVQVRLSQ